jgi:hypothetical protein
LAEELARLQAVLPPKQGEADSPRRQE